MKIEEILIHQVSFPLIRPYKLSYRQFDAFEPFVVRVRDSDGREGWGEIQISRGSSEETPEGGLAYAREHSEKIIGFETEDAKSLIRSTMAASKISATGLITAIEMMEGHHMLEVHKDTQIPILTPFESIEAGTINDEVEARLADGFRTFKLKVGKDVEKDLERVGLIQKAINGRADIRMDANRGFNAEQGCQFASRLNPEGIVLFEQPCPTEDWEGNAKVAKVSTVPIMLDEPICSLADIERAGDIDGVKFCKVKLKRFGGIDLLSDAIDLIRKLDMEAVLGDGTSIEIMSWMEACIAQTKLNNAGEFNGFLKPKDRLFKVPLAFENGNIVLPKGYRAEIDMDNLTQHLKEAPDRFSVTRIAGAAE